MSSSQLKIIALISGGKDSLFSILHCLAAGHEVVALANLHPPDKQGFENEDIDSFMYQTIGHAIIPLYSEALDIPLYRQRITGTAANTSKDYAPASSEPLAGASPPLSDSSSTPPEDETEDLMPLLRRVCHEHPEANAVSTGAILSTYQRTRVESVAIRLGLIPLSYLWQYPYLPPYRQASLLEDMRAVGQDARIIKVASGGLDQSFLWQNVADERVVRRMWRRMEMFGGGEGGAVLGEGGEFETLAVDGPAPLWKRRIEVGEVRRVGGEGGSAVVRLEGARVVMKAHCDAREPGVRIPSLLDAEFGKLLREMESTITKKYLRDADVTRTEKKTAQQLTTLLNDVSSTIVGSGQPSGLNCPKGYIHISNIIHPECSSSEQMKYITNTLSFHLSRLNLSPSSIISSTLLLRTMSDFTTINPIYGSLFMEPLPPSRITVGCGDLLPRDVNIVLSVVIDPGPRERREGLHVQGQSYWAPANIGPYSQAIAVPLRSNTRGEGDQDESIAAQESRMVYVAGQVPLVPAGMELVTASQMPWTVNVGLEDEMRGFVAQAVLALQHLWRIGRAMNIMCWTGGVAYISSSLTSSSPSSHQRAAIAIEAWRGIHEVIWREQQSGEDKDSAEDEEDQDAEVDVWHLRNNRGFETSGTSSKEEEDTRPRLPNYSNLTWRIPGKTSISRPPCFVVQVAELPRGAGIEWCSTGLSRCSRISQGVEDGGMGDVYCTSVEDEGVDCQFIYRGIVNVDDLVVIGNEEAKWSEDDTERKWVSFFTVYTTMVLPKEFKTRWKPQVIPCRAIWGEGGQSQAVREFEAVIVIKRQAS